MGKLSRVTSGVVIFATLTALTSDEAHEPIPDRLSEDRYENFISTLKSLCEDNTYILIGDTNHTSPKIMELVSNPYVLQAINECDKPLFLEAGTEENEGYPVPEYEGDDLSTLEAVRTVQAYLANNYFEGVEQNGYWDEATNDAFFALVVGIQDEFPQLSDQPQGIYTSALGATLASQIDEADIEGQSFLNALDYLDKIKMLPVPATQTTLYQDFQDNNVNYFGNEYLMTTGDYDTSPSDEKNAQLTHDRVFHAASMGLPLKYPDIRYEGQLYKDPELTQSFTFLYEQAYSHDLQTQQGMADFWVQMDAVMNANVDYRQGQAKLEEFLDKSVSVDVNQAIIDNVTALSDARGGVIIYGHGHMSQQNDFDEMLARKGPTATIMLKYAPDQLVSDEPKKQIFADDAPEYIYEIYSDNIIEIDRNDEDNAFEKMKRFHLLPEEYEAAIGKLPEELRPFAFPYSDYDADLENDIKPTDWLKDDKVYRFGDDGPQF